MTEALAVRTSDLCRASALRWALVRAWLRDRVRVRGYVTARPTEEGRTEVRYHVMVKGRFVL